MGNKPFQRKKIEDESDDSSTGVRSAQFRLTPELEAIIGRGPMCQAEITKRIWKYVRKNKLQMKNESGVIFMVKPDSKLSRIVGDDPIHILELQARVMHNIRSSFRITEI